LGFRSDSIHGRKQEELFVLEPCFSLKESCEVFLLTFRNFNLLGNLIFLGTCLKSIGDRFGILIAVEKVGQYKKDTFLINVTETTSHCV
jgi:hypothetical protein